MSDDAQEVMRLRAENLELISIIRSLLHLANTAIRYTGGDSDGEDIALIANANEKIAVHL